MEFKKLKELSKAHKEEVLNLWNNEYPEKLSYKTLQDFEDYLENLAEQFHILMINEKQEIKGWYFDFMRDNEKWFAIILDSKLQGKGLGTRILNMAKEKEIVLCGWVIDHNNYRKKKGEIYKSPIDFYLKNGFKKI